MTRKEAEIYFVGIVSGCILGLCLGHLMWI